MSLALLALAATSACGPPRFDADGGTTTRADDSSEDSVTPETESSGTPDPETDSGPTTDETETFVPEYDAPPEPCDMFLQDCPAGEKCVPYGSTGGNWDSNKCVPILGDQAAGEPCTYGGVSEATDDCDATSICWDVMEVDGEAIGTCATICTGTPDDPECPPGSSCLISGDSSINICIYSCDPLLQDCNPGLACYWANNDFNCIFTTQDIPAGEPCGFINDCAAGLLCASADSLPECAGSACCSPFCDLFDPGSLCDVVPGTSCVPFFEEGVAPPGYEHIGVCILP